MKKYYRLLLFCLLQTSYVTCFNGAAVTSNLPGGWSGDFLMCYVRGQYVAYKYKIPYLLPDLGGYHGIYQELELYHSDLKRKDYIHQFSNQSEIRSNHGINTQSPTLYIINHFFKMADWGDGLNITTWHSLINDETFLNILREKIKFHKPKSNEYDIPTDRISIAVHIRTGRGLDTAQAHNTWPYKFPHVQYYIDQVRKIEKIVKKAIHVHICTDDIKPNEIANQFQNQLKDLNITLSYRNTGNDPKKNVLEDLIFMTQFDCLIRGMSHYSQIAQLLGKYKIIVYPLRMSGRNVVEVGTIIKDDRITKSNNQFVNGLVDELFNIEQELFNKPTLKKIKVYLNHSKLEIDTQYDN